MNGRKYSKQVLWIILITLVLVGCDFLNPTAIAEIEVAFDGNECTASGPSESVTGPHSFILNDLSDKEVELWASRLDEGKTVQDLLDEQGEPGEWWPKPSWFTHTQQARTVWINENGGEVWTYLLDEEGEYVVYVGIDKLTEKKLWFCAQTLVVEAPVE